MQETRMQKRKVKKTYLHSATSCWEGAAQLLTETEMKSLVFTQYDLVLGRGSSAIN